MAASTIPKPLIAKPFSIEKAKRHGLSRYQIYRLAKKGKLERLERGVYRVPAFDINDEDSFRAATQIIGSQSAICLLSALSFYHLTDEIPQKTWVMVDQQKRSTQRNLKLVRVAHPKWDIGIEKHAGYRITSIERTIIESIANQRYLGKMIGIEAIKYALKNKMTTLDKIITTASKLGFVKKIQSVLEVLI